MKIQIKSVVLGGTIRRIEFKPGLNIISGPIASGKTTLYRLIRSILGSRIENLPPEVRNHVRSIAGEVVIGSNTYSVVRPLTTTPTSIVEIAGPDIGLRLPVSQLSQGADKTYLQWLLEVMELPRLEVPSAPTRPDSDPTPLSIRDYLLYCSLSQSEMGFQVFGHRDNYKNIKRKYVFEVLNGIYGIETAQIQEKLRTVQAQLRQLTGQEKVFEKFLEGTALRNRAEIARNLSLARAELDQIERDIKDVSQRGRVHPETELLQRKVLQFEAQIQELRSELNAEKKAMDSLRRLTAQFETQTAKITRSIVAERYLTDIDFIICPRCGTEVDPSTGDDEHCYLCHQEPQPQLTRESLIEEQSRIEAQLSESSDLLRARQEHSEEIESDLAAKEQELLAAREELNFQTQTFVSTEASKIATLAARRAELRSRIDQLNEYQGIYKKLDNEQQIAVTLSDERDILNQQLAEATGKETEIRQRINLLKDHFDSILKRFHPPQFGEESRSGIDSKTYLPIYNGRKFDDLSSPGLATLVNLAHALAHQRTAIELNLPLPNILFLDGLSEHLGEEGLDPQRVSAIYNYLAEISDELGEQLQIIVIDNDVPYEARPYIRLELSEDDRLVPGV